MDEGWGFIHVASMGRSNKHMSTYLVTNRSYTRVGRGGLVDCHEFVGKEGRK